MTPFEIGYALDVFTEQPHVSDVKLALIRLDVPIDQMPQAQREYVIELLEELYEVQ